MRYLRTSQDFLFSHLQHLPFNLPGEDEETMAEKNVDSLDSRSNPLRFAFIRMQSFVSLITASPFSALGR